MTLLAIFAVSLACCLALTPIVRSLAIRYGLVDGPDGRRKLQAKPIPLGGGLAIFLSAVAAVGAAVLFSPLREELLAQSPMLIGLGLAVLLIAAVGLIDDARGLRGRHKVMGQFAAVVIVMWCGVLVRHGALLRRGRSTWDCSSFPFTAFLLLGAINSLNLLDGMDGLLSCIGLIICLAMAAIAAHLVHWPAACIAAALAGALLGFLRYNSPPASIFMGDCGSMVVGLVIGVVAIQGSLKGPATVALIAPLTILTLPIFDTLAAIVRRKLTGRSIYAADRGHLHHCLLRSGLSAPRVLGCVAVLSLVTFLGAGQRGLARRVGRHRQRPGRRPHPHRNSTLRTCGIRVIEKTPGRQAVSHRSRRQAALSGGSPPGSADWSSLWRDLAAWADDLGLKSLCLDINAPALHEAYLGRWEQGGDEPDDINTWRTQIPLMAGGHSLGRLEIVGCRDEGSASAKIAILAGLVDDLEFALGATVRLAPLFLSPTAETRDAPLAQLAVNGHRVAAGVATATAVLCENGNSETHPGTQFGAGAIPSPKKPR